MSSPPHTGARMRARYLHVDGAGAILALLHEPPAEHARAKAVLFCPPFGWEELCSYRRRRDWAQALANDGYATLRLDLPGTGDSAGSPFDDGSPLAWRDSICAAADWLRTTTGAHAVTGVGIGLGGLLLCDAIGAGAGIDELVLWATPGRGASFVRELRAFGRLEAAGAITTGKIAHARQEEIAAIAGGFVLTRATMAALEGLDATAIDFPTGRPRRVLMFERDGIPVDEPLREHLLGGGAEVVVRPGNGYSEMIAPPHEGHPPHEVIEATRSWLGGDGTAAAAGRDESGPNLAFVRSVCESDSLELAHGNAVVRESEMRIAQPFGQLFGVLAQPVDIPVAPVSAILLNAGAHRHIGQARMWVDAARRWAAAGVPTLRVDLEGIGDSDGDGARFTDSGELYDARLVEQARSVLDALDARGFGPRYIAAGLCSGAYWSFHMALRDPRTSAAVMINPQAIFWDRSLHTARMLRRSSKLKVLRGEVKLARLWSLAAGLPGLTLERARARVRSRAGGSELDRALDTLRADGKRVHFLFSGCEPLREELEAQGWPDSATARWPNVSFGVIPGDDHILRPLPAQQFVHDALDRALEVELALAAIPPGRGDDRSKAEDTAADPHAGGAAQVVRIISTEQGA